MITYSVIIPLKDEAQSLPILYNELKETLNKLNASYEIIFIDDGSTDDSFSVLTKLQKDDKRVKIITFRANFGKSAALTRGFKEAKGNILIQLDADLQDDPKEIPLLLEKLHEGYDLVCGWRKKRSDTLTKKISSYLFNRGTVFLSGVNLHDFNCGLKVFKKEVAEEIFLHSELHRFIPLLAAKRKFKVTEHIVSNRPRRFGISKYGRVGIGRSWKGAVDLLTSIFITDYATKPAHFFGKLGIPLFSGGFLMSLYVTYVKVSTGTTQGKTPLLIAGVFFMLTGIQLLSTGLIAEMIVSLHHRKKE